MIRWKLYADNNHKFPAIGKTKQQAWELIRDRCVDEGLDIPLINDVMLVRKLSISESRKISERVKDYKIKKLTT